MKRTIVFILDTTNKGFVQQIKDKNPLFHLIIFSNMNIMKLSLNQSYNHYKTNPRTHYYYHYYYLIVLVSSISIPSGSL